MYLSAAAFLMTACQPEENKGSTLDQLLAQRDSIKEVYSELGVQLSAIETQVYELQKEQGISKKLPVSTQKLTPQPFEHYVDVQGVIEADKNIVITAENAGTVKTVHVKEGQLVNAGQLLVSLDTDIQDQNLAELKNSLELASFVYEKQERLWKQNIGSELELRQAKNNKLSLETKIASLKAQMRKSKVYAPFSGTIDEITPKLGESVSPGMPIARLVNISQVKVKAEVSESYAATINKRSKAKVVLPATNEEVEVNLTQVGNYINPGNRTFKVVAQLKNTNRNILPNMVAHVLVRDYYNDNAVVVPNKTIMQDLQGESYVYVVDRDQEIPTIEKVAVETGRTYKGFTEVLAGLGGIEEIVVEGARNVKPGDVVSILQ